MGWFFGFKLQLIINGRGEILNFMFTTCNVNDREPLYSESFIENVKGKLCGDLLADFGGMGALYVAKTAIKVCFLSFFYKF